MMEVKRMSDQDKMIMIGSKVNMMLSKENNIVCNECVIHNSKDLYITIEPVGSPWSITHKYICRYIRKQEDFKKIPLKSMKTFVVHITLRNGIFVSGIETHNSIVDYLIIDRCVKLLLDMHEHASNFSIEKATDEVK